MAKKHIDKEYVKQLKKGDIKAFDSIYSFYKDSIYFFVLSIVKNAVEAEDVVQETFIKALTKIDQLRKVESFHAWIFTLAYNESIASFQTNKKTANFESEFLEDMLQDDTLMNDVMDRSEVLQAVDIAIKKLSDKHLQIAQLYYLNEMTIREVTKVLGIPKSTVSNRVKAIEKLLQDELKEKGYEPSRYFSITGIPLLFFAMQHMLNKNKLDNTISARIKDNVVKDEKVVSKYKKQVRLSNSILTSLVSSKFVVVFLVIIIASATIILLSDTKQSNLDNDVESIMNKKVAQTYDYIQSVEYDDSLTRDNVAVTVTLQQQAKVKDINVKHEDKEVKFTVEGNKLNFDAASNGIYKITVGNDHHKLSIDNLDAHAPTLTDAKYKPNKRKLQLYTVDEKNRIDFDKSYVKFEDKEFKISKTGNVNGVFSDQVEVYLFDKISGINKYFVKIDKEI